MPKKSIEELERSACLYWPSELSIMAAETSVIPLLINTQDKFLSILKSSDREPDSWKCTLENASTLSAGLFLKHLMVLSDFGGERLQRLSKDAGTVFPENIMEFEWNTERHTHTFHTAGKPWTNKTLNVDKSLLAKNIPISREMLDVAMLLMWGANIINNDNIPAELREKCLIGKFLGNTEELDQFVRQRYIYVSRITGGSTVNDLGHACEQFVRKFLLENLDDNHELSGHTIEDISHNNKDLTSFDLVVRNKTSGVHYAMEISFQVTTNSVIERKAGLAKSRKTILNREGHKVIYIIDGSGNFQRKNAVQTIIEFSDLTVNFSTGGLEELVAYINSDGTI